MKNHKLLLSGYIVSVSYVALFILISSYFLNFSTLQVNGLTYVLGYLHFLLLFIGSIFHGIAYFNQSRWACISAGSLYAVGMTVFPLSIMVYVFVIVSVFMASSYFKKNHIYKIR